MTNTSTYVPVTKTERIVADDLIADIDGVTITVGQVRFADLNVARSALVAIASAPDHGYGYRGALRALRNKVDALVNASNPTGMCSDCGTTHFPIHPDSLAQRGEPICTRCVAAGAFA